MKNKLSVPQHHCRLESLRTTAILDLTLITALVLLAFAMTAHPYFFGDELVPRAVALSNGHSFTATFEAVSRYKPRILFNGIEALLSSISATRYVSAMIVAVCMAWINILLYLSIRKLLAGTRALALMVVAVTLTSRYGAMFFFDYVSGLIELLATALLLSSLVCVRLAWIADFKRSFAAIALAAAILCVATHERYAVAFLAAGGLLLLIECFGGNGRRRSGVLVWCVGYGMVPLLLFVLANNYLGGNSLLMGTAGQTVKFGGNTLWTGLTYSYNVFLGGNYGYDWFWGTYNYHHPVGKLIGLMTGAWTVVMLATMAFRREIVWRNQWVALVLLFVSGALVAVASLPGTERQEARFMFPAGVMSLIMWIVLTRDRWRYAIVGTVLMTNIFYVATASYDSIYNIAGSRSARALASSLRAVAPSGLHGIVIGNVDNDWTIGGGSADARPGMTFSHLNLQGGLQIDPLISQRPPAWSEYDFALVYSGLGPHREAIYQTVSIAQAENTLKPEVDGSELDKLPVQDQLGDSLNWGKWHYTTPMKAASASFRLSSRGDAWISVPAQKLTGRRLVYSARATKETAVPMRLQVNWHAAENNRFISSSIRVVALGPQWHSYSMLLYPPPGASSGNVYMSLHDGTQGEAEVQSVNLK
jgi:hypothetical protein